MEQKLTHEMTSVKLELNSKIISLDASLNARMDSLDASLNARVDSLESNMNARFKQVDARFDHMDSKIETVLAAVQRVGLLVEEQNARNKFVLDGYTSLCDRVEKLERRDGDKDV